MQNQTKRNLKLAIISVFFLFIVIFIFFNSRNIIFGVKIKNVNINSAPAIENMKVADSVMKITGKAKNAVNIKLNGREISIDQKGNFDETISLFLGYNLVNIKAQDKFGNVDEKNYQLIY
jgi:hypothetical protein